MYTSKQSDKTRHMDQINSDAGSCQKCSLGNQRKNVVVGSGSLDANIVLIGEAPGRKEDESGLPFMGSAGKLLDGLLDKSGICREEVFIGNILKCRPPGNRRPKRTEIRFCESFLIRQLEIIKPNVIAPMGNSALDYFQSKYNLQKAVIGNVHGNEYEIETSWGKVKLVPLYHPAAAIYRRQLLEDLEKDMKKVTRL